MKHLTFVYAQMAQESHSYYVHASDQGKERSSGDARMNYT